MMKFLLPIVLFSISLGICINGCGNETTCTNAQNQCVGDVANNCLMTCTSGPCWYSMHEANCQEQGLGSCRMVTQKPYPFMCNSGMAGTGEGPWAACEKWTQPQCSLDQNKCEGSVAYSCHEYCCGEGCVYFYSETNCGSGTCYLNEKNEAYCKYPQASCPDGSYANSGHQ
jgi:hypothetical protein